MYSASGGPSILNNRRSPLLLLLPGRWLSNAGHNIAAWSGCVPIAESALVARLDETTRVAEFLHGNVSNLQRLVLFVISNLAYITRVVTCDTPGVL